MSALPLRLYSPLLEVIPKGDFVAPRDLARPSDPCSYCRFVNRSATHACVNSSGSAKRLEAYEDTFKTDGQIPRADEVGFRDDVPGMGEYRGVLDSIRIERTTI